MKKLLPALFITIAFLVGHSAKAQTTDSVNSSKWMHHQFAGTMQIQVTYRQSRLGELNNALTGSGIGKLGANDFWINASMNHAFGKWIEEDGIGFTPISSSDLNGIKAKYNQYQIYGRLGYNVLNKTNMRLFPFAGINFSAAVLDIQDKNGIQSTSSFSGELRNSTYSKTFYQPNFGIDLGIGYDNLIPVKAKDMGCFMVQRYIPIGVRAGYYIHAAQSDWRIDSYKLQDGPDNKQGSIFVSVNIGLGFEVKK